MAIHVINKISSRLIFLYRKNRFLNFPLLRLLYNAMIQPFFDYTCNACYPNINKKLKMRLQAAQNKCIRFCLTLFRMGIFGAAHGWGGPKRPLTPKICHRCSTMMKIGIDIPYLTKIQKLYESRDTHPDFCWH